MNLFYLEHPPAEGAGTAFTLTGREAGHAARVLRVARGETLHATDGEGLLYRGKVSRVTEGEVRAELLSRERQPLPRPDLVLAIGMIKKRDRLEFAVEKSVELGVRRVVVFAADRSEKSSIRVDRLESTALAAMKQSLRCWLPKIATASGVDELLDRFAGMPAVAADEQADGGRWPQIGKELLAIVGPEGGLSDRERAEMIRRGVTSVSLGPGRLRSETAAIAIAARFSHRQQ